jgi:hypothetical protein
MPPTSWARAVLVHAIDESAKKFYLHFNFEPSPIPVVEHLPSEKGEIANLLRGIFQREKDCYPVHLADASQSWRCQ